MSARVSWRNGRISRKDDRCGGHSKLSDARGTLNLINNVMRVVRFWWYIGDTGSPIVNKSCKPWITFDALPCYIILNRKSARIINSLWADCYNNSSPALKAVPTQQQQPQNVTHYNSRHILIAVLTQAIYLQQHLHRSRNT